MNNKRRGMKQIIKSRTREARVDLADHVSNRHGHRHDGPGAESRDQREEQEIGDLMANRFATEKRTAQPVKTKVFVGS